MKKQVLLIVLMLMPLVASADKVWIDGIYYDLISLSEGAEVSRYRYDTSIYTGSISIPESVTYGGLTYSVTSIGMQAFYESSVTSITIPNSVTSIGDEAFYGCSEITSIVIPNSVTSIGDNVFYGCSGLTSLTIPNSVTSIGVSIFENCSNLTSVKVESGNLSYDSRRNCNAIVKTSTNELIAGCKSTIIPNGVTSIGVGAFNGCSGLTSIYIPNSVASISNYAFYGCSDLTSIIIGVGIETIGVSAFSYCESLEDVYCYAEKVPSTETNAFDGSYIAYATLHVPDNSINQYRRRAPWSGFETFTGILEEEYNDGNKCEKPVITLLANGKIKVECATEGATCVTNITASNADPLTDGEINLNTPLIVYTVTAYATKEGHDDSEVATATFRYEKTEGDMNGDGQVNVSDVVQLVNTILSK